MFSVTAVLGLYPAHTSQVNQERNSVILTLLTNFRLLTDRSFGAEICLREASDI